MKLILPPALSRRAFLAAGAAAAWAAFPHSLIAGPWQGGGALAFDGEMLVAAGERLLRLSLDGGAEEMPAPARPIRALASHPDRPGRLFAAPEGGGALRSDDGGRTWRAAGSGLPAAQVAALAVAAAAPDTIYAAVVGDGIWRSEDAGESWSFVMDRPWIAEAEREVRALASVNLASGMGGIWIYAGTETGLTRVPDCFCRWQDVVAGDAMDALVAGAAPAPTAPLPAGEPVLALASAHAAAERLHSALPSGLWASVDGGVAWTRQSDLRAAALAIHPRDPDHIVAATDGGLSQSRDGGTTWAALAAI